MAIYTRMGSEVTIEDTVPPGLTWGGDDWDGTLTVTRKVDGKQMIKHLSELAADEGMKEVETALAQARSDGGQ